MAIYRTKDPADAARFARALEARGYQRIATGRRTMRAGTFRVRAYRRGWFGVVYGELAHCHTPGHEARKAEAHGLCASCWSRERYQTDPRMRERRKAAAKAYYSRLSPEQKAARQERSRILQKIRRWAA